MFIRDNTNNKESKVHSTEVRSIIKSKINNSSPYHSLERALMLVLTLVISHRLAPKEGHQHTTEDRGFVPTQLVSKHRDTLAYSTRPYLAGGQLPPSELGHTDN